MSDPTEKPSRQRWHIRKELSIGHIATTLGIVAALFLGYSDLRENDIIHDKGISSLSTKIAHEKELQALRHDNQREVDKAQNGEIRKIYNQIEDARQEFRDEHKLTRSQVMREQKETRTMMVDMLKKPAKGD